MDGNIIELVKLGHERAADLKDSFEAINACSVAQLISDLATQLDVQFARSNALAAENAALKATKEIIRHLNVNREEANFCGIDDCHIDDAIEAMVTPATDAFLAEVRAQGVEMFGEHVKAYNHSAGWQAKHFAAQLRKGAAQ